MFSRRHRYSVSVQGMTLLEMVVAMMMLVMFTGVVVAVLEVTSRFAGELEPTDAKGRATSQGVLIDHQEIQIGLDQLAEVLGQPGISKRRLDGEVAGYPQIAFPASADPDQVCAPAGSDPLLVWRLPGPALSFPAGYRICVWRTGLVEASTQALLDRQEGAHAGLYVIQALPEQASAASLPTRRLFCRPRPFC